MPASVEEAAAQSASRMGAANKAGLEQLSDWQVVTFTKYNKVVLPLDGFVFWVNAGILSGASALFNAAPFNTFNYNQAPIIGAASENTNEIKCSVHYSTTADQGDGQNIEINRVVFTSEEEIQEFNDVAPTEMWLGSLDNIRFAFTSRSSFYRQAGLWHYVGDAVYPDMETQIIDRADQINTKAQIVSNSLPLWLSLNGGQGIDFNCPIALYPAFLSPENLHPPFATVYIPPDSTMAIQAAPLLVSNLTHYQLVKEKVRITFWGCNNAAVMQFMEFVNEWSMNYDLVGIMNMPVPRDEHRTQSELFTIAQKKTMEYEISYYQQVARTVARKLIRSAIVNYEIEEN